MDNTIKTGEGQESTDNYQLSIANCQLKRIALFDRYQRHEANLFLTGETAGGDPRALQGRTARTGHVVRLPDGRFRPTDECRVYPARYSYGERFRI